MSEPVIPPELIAAERAKKEAETRRADAEAAKFLQERDKIALETRLEELAVAGAEIHYDRERHKRQKELAADEFHLFYAFNGGVDASSVNKCIDQLTVWMRTRPGEPIEIQFNSPGGSIIHGMALWDFIQMVKSQGHEVTTSSIGYAASMGGILLQAGHKRIMGRESYLMLHEASFGASGKIGEVDDTVEWVKMIQARVLEIFASRSNLSKAQIKRKWTRTDWWMDSEQALKHGFVDEIR